MIRIGIIGVGFGAAVHLPAFHSLPGVRVVAVGSRRPEKAREVANRFGIEIAGTVYDVLRAPLDAVSIALPPALTAEVAADALERGLAVLAEKPLAQSANRAEALARAARGRTTAVAFQFAELDCFRALEQLLRPNAERRLVSVHVVWQSLSYAQRTRTWGWKTDADQHGGVTNLLGSHVLYILDRLIGPIVELSAKFSNAATRAFAPPGAPPAEDTAAICGLTAAGAPIRIDLSNAELEQHGQRWLFTADGEQLVVEGRRGEVLGPLWLARLSGNRQEVLVAPPLATVDDPRLEPFRRLAERFVSAAERGESCTPDFAAGARVQRLIEACRVSAASGGATQPVSRPAQ